MIKGIQFLFDERGKAKSVLIDLDEHGELWEDFYDVLMIEAAKGQPTIPWEQLEAEMEEEIERQRAKAGSV